MDSINGSGDFHMCCGAEKHTQAQHSHLLPSEGRVGHSVDAQTFPLVLFVCVYVC